MKKTEVRFEEMIEAYAKLVKKDGIFVQILERDEKLAEILKLTSSKMGELQYGYLYLTDFNNEEEMTALFTRITEEPHPDAQYVALLQNGKITKEFPDW